MQITSNHAAQNAGLLQSIFIFMFAQIVRVEITENVNKMFLKHLLSKIEISKWSNRIKSFKGGKTYQHFVTHRCSLSLSKLWLLIQMILLRTLTWLSVWRYSLVTVGSPSVLYKNDVSGVSFSRAFYLFMF